MNTAGPVTVFVNRLAFLLYLPILTCFGLPCYSQLWKSYSDTAKTYAARKSIDTAVFYYKKAASILIDQTADSTAYVIVNRNMGDVYAGTGRFTEALPYYQRAARLLLTRAPLDSLTIANYNSLGIVYYNIGDYEAAASSFKAVKDANSKLYSAKGPVYARSCTNVANILSLLGKYNEAEKYYLEAIDVILTSGSGKESREYAQAANGLSSLYKDMGEYEKAEPFAIDAKEIRGRLLSKDDPTYALSCITLANLYRSMGQYEKAVPLYTEAKDIREKAFGKNHPLYVASCNILADTYGDMQQFDKAEPLYLEAKELGSKMPDKMNLGYAQTCNNLATLYADNHLPSKAEALALEAKSTWEKLLPKDHPSLAVNYNNLGGIYFALEKYDSAKVYTLRAKQLWETNLGKDHPYYAQNSNSLAKIYRNTGDKEKATALYNETLKSQYAQLNRVFRFTSEAEKGAYLNTVNSTMDEFQSFVYSSLSHNNAAASFNTSLAGRNMVLSSIQQLRYSIYNSHDAALQDVYEQWAALKQQLANLYVKTGENNNDSLENVSEQLEKYLSRQSSQFSKLSNQSADWKQIQQQLRPSEAAIEFISFRFYNGKRWTDSTFYAALVLRKDKPAPQFVYLFEQRSLDSLLYQAGSASDATISNLYTRGVHTEVTAAMSKSLYQLIWAPVDKTLKGITQITFAPAGLLHRISFAALPVNDKQVLMEKYHLSQVSSTAALLNKTNNTVTSTDNLVLYGGIDYDQGQWPALPGTVTEVEKLQQLADSKKIKAVRLEGQRATEASVRANTGASLLHIASHGFFFPDSVTAKQHNVSLTGEGAVFMKSSNPLFRSGLLFAGANKGWTGRQQDAKDDGILTSYEVSNLYFAHAKLVVLSACETGLGDIHGSEGVYGLQRAFKMAGVQNMVMSLWQVPDAETAEFMQLFYKNMFDKQSIDDAFYHAQLTMKNKYRQSPFKWAAWVLIR